MCLSSQIYIGNLELSKLDKYHGNTSETNQITKNNHHQQKTENNSTCPSRNQHIPYQSSLLSRWSFLFPFRGIRTNFCYRVTQLFHNKTSDKKNTRRKQQPEQNPSTKQATIWAFQNTCHKIRRVFSNKNIWHSDPCFQWNPAGYRLGLQDSGPQQEVSPPQGIVKWRLRKESKKYSWYIYIYIIYIKDQWNQISILYIP